MHPTRSGSIGNDCRSRDSSRGGEQRGSGQVQEGLVDEIHPMEVEVWIQFGIESARVKVVGMIHGQGLLGELYVLENDLPLVLISDISFTEKGVVLIQDNEQLLGVAHRQIEVVGWRDPQASRTDKAAMWQLDLRALIQRPDPRLRAKVEEERHQITAEEVVRLMQAAWDAQDSEKEEAETGRNMWCAGARPTFSVADVRMGRRFLKNMGVSPFTMAVTLEQQALGDIPTWLTPALIRAIGHSRGNVPGILSTERKEPLAYNQLLNGLPSTPPALLSIRLPTQQHQLIES